MKAELKAKWLEALRSGQHKQGHARLKRVDRVTGEPSFCCLGLLCELAGVPQAPDELTSEVRFGVDKLDSSLVYLPNTFAESADVELSSDDQRQLANMNDGSDGEAQAGFPAIADWIEANVPVTP